jgi:Transposase DDE domain
VSSTRSSLGCPASRCSEVHATGHHVRATRVFDLGRLTEWASDAAESSRPDPARRQSSASRSFNYQRNTQAITAEAALDGLYVIRTTVAAEQMDPAKVVATYKSLARVERDFRSLKAIDVDLRPIHHYTETRVRAHVFICMLAAHLAWHLRHQPCVRAGSTHRSTILAWVSSTRSAPAAPMIAAIITRRGLRGACLRSKCQHATCETHIFAGGARLQEPLCNQEKPAHRQSGRILSTVDRPPSR